MGLQSRRVAEGRDRPDPAQPVRRLRRAGRRRRRAVRRLLAADAVRRGPRLRRLRRAAARGRRAGRPLRRVPGLSAGLEPGPRGAALPRHGAGGWCWRSSTATGWTSLRRRPAGWRGRRAPLLAAETRAGAGAGAPLAADPAALQPGGAAGAGHRASGPGTPACPTRWCGCARRARQDGKSREARTPTSRARSASIPAGRTGSPGGRFCSSTT